MTDTDKPTPEAERGDILREHRAQSIEVDWDMLLARGQDAERTPGRRPLGCLQRTGCHQRGVRCGCAVRAPP